MYILSINKYVKCSYTDANGSRVDIGLGLIWNTIDFRECVKFLFEVRGGFIFVAKLLLAVLDVSY